MAWPRDNEPARPPEKLLPMDEPSNPRGCAIVLIASVLPWVALLIWWLR